MSAFVANQPAPAEAIITNAPFFPDIDPADFRQAVRQDGTITPERVASALTAGIIEVNDELAYFVATQLVAGHAELSDVPAPVINGESRLLGSYRRAVYAIAKAALVEHYSDYDATRSGRTRDEDKPDADMIYRREARWAIADLLGKSRMKVELI